jgi:outer membrane protein assembly factor BamB
MHYRMLLACLLLWPVCLCGANFESRRSNNWHHWRGPNANGSAPHGQPPLSWDGEKNVRWKTAIPGVGSSTPIVWGDQIFLLTAVQTERIDPSVPPPEEQPDRPFGIKFPRHIFRFVVLSLDRKDGSLRWETTVAEELPNEGHHSHNDFAAMSPTTDGEGLYVSFGSRGVFRLDLNGKLIWRKDLGDVETRLSFGEASSPVIHGDAVVLNRDHEGQSHIYVLDANNGDVRWKQPRDERSSWATPALLPERRRTQVIVPASNFVRSYNLADGKLLWQCGGQVGNVTPTPVIYEDLVICMSGYKGNAIHAISAHSKGDVTDTDKVAWKSSEGAPYVPSPLLHRGSLYYLKSNSGILSCVDPSTGEPHYKLQRIQDLRNIYASPVGASDRVYLVDREGTTVVVEAGSELKVLATNRLGEPIDASPAIVGSQLFLRGEKHLYCIEEKKATQSASSWPDFRGPSADGHSDATGLPLHWSEDENIVWKTRVHDLGWSTPVILGGQVWMTTATPDGKKMYAVCVDQETGRTIHDELVFENAEPRPLGNAVNCYAAPSPTIEEGRVYVSFGSYGTACLDTKTAEVLWERRDLPCNHFRGPASSVVLYEGLLIFHMDGSDHDYIVALKTSNGETAWKTLRSTDYGDLDENGLPKANGDGRKAYNTPTFFEVGGHTLLVSPAAKAAYAYEPLTGKEVWQLRYPNHSTAARSLFGHGLLYINIGYSRAQLWAVRPDGDGILSDSHVVWKRDRQVANRSSPLLIDDSIYMCTDRGVATCLDAETGEEVWAERVGGDYSSSLLYAEGRIYCFSHQGATTVLAAGRKFEVLAKNHLAEGFMSSPAVSGKALYLRTRTHLYRVEQTAKTAD